METTQVTRNRSLLRQINRRLGNIEKALEGMNRSLELVALALNPPREQADDQCPADNQQGYRTHTQGNGPEKQESSAA